MNKRPDPLQTIQKLIKERYRDAKAVFWAGSVSQTQGTSASDLDLVIVYDSIHHAYREAYIYDGWPIDAFVHDIATLRYFFEESRTGNGISGLATMIMNGTEVTRGEHFSENIKNLVKKFLEEGPVAWSKEQIDKERFLITDVMDDIKYPASQEEQIVSAAWLYEALSQFYFRSKAQWRASGKSIVRYLKKDNPQLALEFTQSFDKVFQRGDAADLEKLIQKILAPFGGLCWDGFESHAPKAFKIPVTDDTLKSISRVDHVIIQIIEPSQAEKICRELTFGLPEWFGIPEANERYAKGCAERTSFAAIINNSYVGMLTLEFLFPNNANIYWMAVDRKYHGKKIGLDLLQTAEKYCAENGCDTITVETLSPKQNDPHYLKTYQFYQKNGFNPLFELSPYGPALLMCYMIKSINRDCI